MKHVVALSGGKDSTAMALRLAELGEHDYTYICTPTGNELPEMVAHWEMLEQLLGQPIERLSTHTLGELIVIENALPNWRMRWCTRQLKIEPALRYYARTLPVSRTSDSEPMSQRKNAAGFTAPILSRCFRSVIGAGVSTTCGSTCSAAASEFPSARIAHGVMTSVSRSGGPCGVTIQRFSPQVKRKRR